MQGLHVAQPGSRTIDLETFVSASHFLRRIDRVLDLSFIRELTAPRYANRGRPSTAVFGPAKSSWFTARRPCAA